MKKYLKYIIILILVLLIILIAYYARNYILLQRYSTEIKSNNYYMSKSSYNFDEVHKTEKYYKDGKMIVNVYYGDIKYTIYQDENNIKMINNDGKIIKDEKYIPKTDLDPNNKTLIGASIGRALSVKITSEICNGKECYLFEHNKIRVWVEKETGLVIREISEISSNNNNEFDVVTDYTYTFDNVTDEQVKEPQ